MTTMRTMLLPLKSKPMMTAVMMTPTQPPAPMTALTMLSRRLTAYIPRRILSFPGMRTQVTRPRAGAKGLS